MEGTDTAASTFSDSLFEFGKTAGYLFVLAVVLWYLLLFLVGKVDQSWFDRQVRRRWWGLRGAFTPRFELEPLTSPGGEALGRSIAALITDELSNAEPSGTRLERASPDKSASVAEALAESSSYLKALGAIRARLVGMRRYVVRGTVHHPTKTWRSMTLEILGRDGRVLANRTFFSTRLAGTADDTAPQPAARETGPPPVTDGLASPAPEPADGHSPPEPGGPAGSSEALWEAYVLVPRASAWLVYTLHDIFRFPSDRVWQRHRFTEQRHGWRPHGPPLTLVGTTNWQSYGYFRDGMWMEWFHRETEARDAYIEALRRDRHNLGALLNLVNLDTDTGARSAAQRRTVFHRLEMSINKMRERAELLVPGDTGETVHRQVVSADAAR